MKTKITLLITVFVVLAYCVSARTDAERSATLKVHFKELTPADVTAIGQRFLLHGLNDVSIISSDMTSKIIEIQFSGKPEEQRKIQQIFLDAGLKFFYAPD